LERLSPAFEAIRYRHLLQHRQGGRQKCPRFGFQPTEELRGSEPVFPLDPITMHYEMRRQFEDRLEFGVADPLVRLARHHAEKLAKRFRFDAVAQAHSRLVARDAERRVERVERVERGQTLVLSPFLSSAIMIPVT